ncbi:MAG: UvrD-helicase domain-containing protein [Elusimicrobia bacterium]|nr:UvrD-helicase domain-containing protein [Elusimicrobiota bacterium]
MNEVFRRQLNPQQLEAVRHKNGPILVLAGAGTGKTRVITYRIANLITEGVKPEKILAVTFTNKAADEMKERVARLTGASGLNVWISTFHSFALRLLRTEYRNYGYAWDFAIFDEVDQRNIMKQILKELELDDVLKPRVVLYYIDIAKGNLLDSESATIYSFFDTKISKELVEIYRIYQNRLKDNNAKDFGDLLLDIITFFKQHPDALEKYQNYFQYILVDEYQDTNFAQYVLVKDLARIHRNICVVGDDDQAIYSWRGANVSNIRNFEKDWPDCYVVHLEENYRSTRKILEAASAVINESTWRRKKKLWTRRDGGDDVKVGIFRTDKAEAEGIALEILSLVDYSYNYEDIAVFYRTNAQSRIFEETFRKYRIPYKIVGGTGFYERREIKDILAYLYVASNVGDSFHLKRIVNVPTRGIGKKTMEEIEKLSKDRGVAFFEALVEFSKTGKIGKKSREKISNFIENILNWKEEFEKASAAQFVRRILDESGYLAALENAGTYESKDRIENIQEFVNAVRSHEENGQNLREFLYDISLISEKEAANVDERGVSLMTLHLCKGLEFPVVFITGLEEGLLPYSDSLSNVDEMEEERRLCYVGMTRAKEVLNLTAALSRRLWGRWVYHFPSRFLKETGLMK